MVSRRKKAIRIGSKVMVPWGQREIPAKVIDVYGDPPEYVSILFYVEDGAEAIVIPADLDMIRLVS